MASPDSIGPLNRTGATPSSTKGSKRTTWPKTPRRSPNRESYLGADSEGPLVSVAETVLPLLQARILEHTAEALAVDPALIREAVPKVIDPSSNTPDVFVGRLLAAQHALASQSSFPEAQRAEQLRSGMAEGFAEALQLLQDAGALEVETWEVLGGVLGAFEAKLLRLLG